jgi:serine/threonine-protein kinase HipA
MTDRLQVLLGGDRIGWVERSADDRLSFAYEVPDTVVTPLSVAMPPQEDRYTHARINPWLWGLLPEDPQVRQRWARQFQTSAASPFRLLATPVGRDCPGAVQLLREDERPTPSGTTVEWLDEAQVAQRLRDLRADQTAWLGGGDTGQFSLAGAQAKTALLFDPDRGRWAVPQGLRPTTHILEPAIRGFSGHHLNEHLCLTAAQQIGLPAASSQVASFEDQTVIVVERYDRRLVDGRLVRVHQEDLCQALSVMPDDKYQNEGGPTPRQIAELLRRVAAPRAAEADVRRFARALVFNWMIAGTDAHAKNYSLLLAGGQVRLAPLYDLSSALPYDRIDIPGAKLAMKLGGSYRLKDLGGRNVVKMAAELGLDVSEVVHDSLRTAERLPDAFRDAAGDPAVAALKHPLPSKLVDRVALRAARCLKSLQRVA